jgi:AraC family transcriptional regulator, chitin signaling transcriptional activator
VKLKTTNFFLFMLGSLLAFGQTIPQKGMPLLTNYTPQQYQQQGKVWDIASAPNGLVYMAADRGLLEFDGKSWKVYQGSAGFNRSLLIINDSLIYTGSDLDFGVWTRNKFQDFEYFSLYPFKENPQQINEEFWDIHYVNESVVFVSSQYIYVYQNQQLTRITTENIFTGSFFVDNTLYLADKNKGIYVFENAKLDLLFSFPEELQPEIAGIYSWNNNLHLVSKNEGLFVYSNNRLKPVKTDLSAKLKLGNVFSFEQIGDAYLAFGTVLQGLYITDMDGNVIHHINKYKGLFSNTILSVHYDNSGKMWLGLDYGISSLLLNHNITYFYDFRGDFGTGHTATVLNDQFYLGTNQGLYKSSWSDLDNNKNFNTFQLVSGTEGQVWTVQNADNKLLIGHDKGLLIWSDNKLYKPSGPAGVWAIVRHKDFILTGNYNGIAVFEKYGNDWVFIKKMNLILGSCNQLVFENDSTLWVNIPNFGLIRALLDEDLNPVERQIFADSIFAGTALSLEKNENLIQLQTSTSQYRFNSLSNQFEKYDNPDQKQLAENTLTGVYQPLSLQPDYAFYPVFNGFALKYLNYSEQVAQSSPALIFRNIQAFNNFEKRVIVSGDELPPRLNSLSITFGVPNRDDVEYQYKLNKSMDWSIWSSDNTVSLIGLKHGSYKLSVRAMVTGQLIESELTFRILAPWHLSWPAYVLYIIAIGLIILAIRYKHRSSMIKQQQLCLLNEHNALLAQEEKHREKISSLEQERLMDEYDQLKQQLKAKTIELAGKAKENEDKNRLLLSIKEKFEIIQNDPYTSKVRLAEIRRILDAYINTEDRTFEIQMDELHQEFFKKLKELQPSLSGNDLRWCAYLKVGLNSKEIAEILNIQPSSAYISRSRLRKKLGLKPEEDLYDYLNAI